MADSNNAAVSIIAVLAIVILVGLVFYFVTQEADDDIEVDLGFAPVLVLDEGAAAAGPMPSP